MTPATLLAWHRRVAARKYNTSKRRRPGQPPPVRSIARLTIRLAKENPLWGYRRIHGELAKPDVRAAASTTYEILRRGHRPGATPGRTGPSGSSCTRRPPRSWRPAFLTWILSR